MPADGNVELTATEQELLSTVETLSNANFDRIQQRVFTFYQEPITQTLVQHGDLPPSASLKDVQRVYKEKQNPEGTTLDDLRLVKAFSPFSLTAPEDVPSWIPQTIQDTLRQELQPGVTTHSADFFAYSTLLPLLQLVRERGLLGATHPDNRLKQATGGAVRLAVEDAMKKMTNTANPDEGIHPNYAVVHKQENPQAYREASAQYGTEPIQGRILVVLSMEGETGKRSTFTFGDSTMCRTAEEHRFLRNQIESDPRYSTLLDATRNGVSDEKVRLEEEINNTQFPNSDYRVEGVLFGDNPAVVPVPSEATIRENIFGSQILPSAFRLNEFLRNNTVIDPNADRIEAQILGGIHASDCEFILLHESLRDPLQKLIAGLPEFQERIKNLEESGVIQYHP
jgi:hypothetical protein